MEYWCEAYYRIVNYSRDETDFTGSHHVSFKQYIERRLNYILYSLINYFEMYELQNPELLGIYKNKFVDLSVILENIDGYSAVYARKLFNKKFPIVLFVNDKQKYYVTEEYFYDDWDDFVNDDEIEFEKVQMLHIKRLIKKLQKYGYNQLYI